MRPYNFFMLLALAYIFALSSAISVQAPAPADSLTVLSNNENGIRFLRAVDVDFIDGNEKDEEDRVFGLGGLKNELSFLKLNWAAKRAGTAEEKLLARQAQAEEKLKKTLDSAMKKKQENVAKAQQKIKAHQAKAQQKLETHQAKALAKLEKLQASEIAKKAKEIAKNDKRYNRWLLENETPETVYKKLGLEKLVKRGEDPAKSPKFEHYENYLFIYYNRYPNRLEKPLTV